MSTRSRRIYTGRVISLDLTDVVLPNGHEVELEIVNHPGGAAIVAVNAAREVCLIRQYRHVAGGWLWEVPAGKLDSGSPAHTARRELSEEAGIVAGQWESLGTIVSSPGVLAETIHLFLAQELTQIASNPEKDEVLEIHWIPLDVALMHALNGTLLDAKTIIALGRAAHRLGQTAAVLPLEALPG
jgi:ADP-ribose pyrophosphatase